jgi:hypothetical protein
MTLKEAREILAEDALGLTNDEVQQIIDWLDNFADIAIESVEKNNQPKQISVKT